MGAKLYAHGECFHDSMDWFNGLAVDIKAKVQKSGDIPAPEDLTRTCFYCCTPLYSMTSLKAISRKFMLLLGKHG